MERPRRWLRQVSEAITTKELETMRTCVARNCLCGGEAWQKRVTRLGLEHTLRAEGRPRRKPAKPPEN